jgi:hypothetical protein
VSELPDPMDIRTTLEDAEIADVGGEDRATA